ncbi:MAG: sugar ABC transporter permease [Hyphomicrobiales bacterium]|nr:sugar ABC transporter permease [Hyphomicrobiales bacterium]
MPPVPLGRRLAARGLDGATALAAPAAALSLALFVYPFVDGLWLSFHPKTGGPLAAYAAFFSDPFQWRTLPTTLWIALPVTVFNLLVAVPVSLRVRHMANPRLFTTVLVVPITLGTVLVAEGMLNYFGPQGWFNRTLMALHLVSSPVRLVQNYWGVVLSLVVTGFPFTFLLTLAQATGIDPALERAAATLGADARARFRAVLLPLMAPGLAINFCLSFVQAFSVFPTAVLLGAPAGATRVISIAAYQAAYERYDYPLASAIAVVMAGAQLLVVAIMLALRGFAYRGPTGGGKG